MQYFSPSIFYARTWPDFKKIVLSSRIGNFSTQNNRRTRIPRWLGRENEENVARTRNWCGWPSSHLYTSPPFLKLLFTLKHSECKFWWVSPGSILSKNNIIVTKVLADMKCSDLIINWYILFSQVLDDFFGLFIPLLSYIW